MDICILHYSTIQMLEIDYKLIEIFCDDRNFEGLETDTDSFHLVLSEQILTEAFIPEKRHDWNRPCNDYTEVFTQKIICFPELAATHKRSSTRENKIFFFEEI